MGGFVVIGTCVALAHHFFCDALSGRPSNPIEFSFLKFTIDFPWALTIGNFLAWLVQFLFTLSIGEVIVQRFWQLLHEKSIDLEKMDDVYQIQTTFWKPSMWHCAIFLSILAAILLAMSATLSTFTSPALSVGPTLLYGPCGLSTVDLGRSELIVAGGSATPALVQLAIRTLESGSYLPPLTSPCGNCTYNVTYFAPALQCSQIDITSSPFPNDSVTDTVLWNSGLGPDPSGVGHELFVWLRQGSITSGKYTDPEIVSCKALNATYYASVGYITGAMVNTTVQIIPNVDGPSGSATLQQTAFSAMMLALEAAIQGRLDVTTSADGKNVSVSDNTLVAYSPLGNFSPQSWAINGDLLTVLPSLMQNISIGLLARSVAADSSSSTLSSVAGHCSVETVVYQYDKVRLLSIYGVGILITAVCAVFGIQSLKTGKGGNISFNSMMLAILSPQMMGKMNEGGSFPSAIRAVEGRFVPADHSLPVPSKPRKWLCW
ncbi:hypothetical protein BD410DRAFT_464396 [Rickenella mellea]|uniref:Transmembrane protein n=1 Tax=Rickenella mellea TaxID=50990 RepID=A0A4Y7PUG4_9AGAM|nr:hypothetical protein BD410DRAFT_464396 [Rickenella mellea]